MRRIHRIAENVVSRLRKQLELKQQIDSIAAVNSLSLQTLEDRVLYSAVPLPVDLAQPPSESPDELIEAVELFEASDVEASLDFTFETVDHLIGDESFAHQLTEVTEPVDTFPSLQSVAEIQIEPSDQDEAALFERSNERVTLAGSATAVAVMNRTTVEIDEGDFVIFNAESFTSLGLSADDEITLVQEPLHGRLYGDSGEIAVNQTFTVGDLEDQDLVFVTDLNVTDNAELIFEPSDTSVFSGNIRWEVIIEGVADDSIATVGDIFEPTGPVELFTISGEDSDIAVLDDGSYVITWIDTNEQVAYFQRFNADGTTVGDAIPTSTVTTGTSEVQIAALDDGEFVIAWQGDSDGEFGDIYFQRFANDGSRIGNLRASNDVTNGDLALTSTFDGGFALLNTAEDPRRKPRVTLT